MVYIYTEGSYKMESKSLLSVPMVDWTRSN